MRIVLVLLALGLLAWAALTFLPSSEVEGKGEEEPPAAISFLERPGSAPAAEPAAAGREPGPAPAAAAEPEAGPDAGPVEVFGLSAEKAPSNAAQDVPLARALLFGGPEDVERALGRLEVGDRERRLYLAFAQAMEGDRKGGIHTARGLDADDALAPEDRALLEAALSGKDPASVARRASSAGASATRRAMRLRLLEREAAADLAAARYAPAAASYSELLLEGLRGPWEAEREALAAWSAGLNQAQARHRWDPRGTWPSVEIVVEDGDSLTHVRKRYLAAHPDGLLCTGMIARANQISGFIHPGDTLRVPTDRAWTLVDLSSRWLLYVLGDEVAAAWEVGIGRDGQETIQGIFRVGEKQEEPTWFQRGQQPAYYPDNPLGTRWIAWHQDGEKTGYGFHGTWEPESIGSAASDGCIRLRNEDVEVLFEILPVGAEIRVEE